MNPKPIKAIRSNPSAGRARSGSVITVRQARLLSRAVVARQFEARGISYLDIRPAFAKKFTDNLSGAINYVLSSQKTKAIVDYKIPMLKEGYFRRGKITFSRRNKESLNVSINEFESYRGNPMHTDPIIARFYLDVNTKEFHPQDLTAELTETLNEGAAVVIVSELDKLKKSDAGDRNAIINFINLELIGLEKEEQEWAWQRIGAYLGLEEDLSASKIQEHIQATGPTIVGLKPSSSDRVAPHYPDHGSTPDISQGGVSIGYLAKKIEELRATNEKYQKEGGDVEKEMFSNAFKALVGIIKKEGLEVDVNEMLQSRLSPEKEAIRLLGKKSTLKGADLENLDPEDMLDLFAKKGREYNTIEKGYRFAVEQLAGNPEIYCSVYRPIAQDYIRASREFLGFIERLYKALSMKVSGEENPLAYGIDWIRKAFDRDIKNARKTLNQNYPDHGRTPDISIGGVSIGKSGPRGITGNPAIGSDFGARKLIDDALDFGGWKEPATRERSPMGIRIFGVTGLNQASDDLAAKGAQRSLRILLVDDDSSFIEVVKFLLEDEGYIVDMASGTEQALKLFEPGKYRGLISDMDLRETGDQMEGLRLIQKFTAQEPHLTVIAQSGNFLDKHNDLLQKMNVLKHTKGTDWDGFISLVNKNMPKTNDSGTGNSTPAPGSVQ